MLDWQTLSIWSILLVDDEVDNLEVIAEAFMFRGVTVHTAEDGVDALEILKSITPTLILTDLSMPKMDGWQLRVRVKSMPQTAAIPIVALTAHAMVGDKERALDVGFDGYMTKPINVPTIIQDLRAALASFEASHKTMADNTIPKVETAVLSIVPQPQPSETAKDAGPATASQPQAKEAIVPVATPAAEPTTVKDESIASDSNTVNTPASVYEVKAKL